MNKVNLAAQLRATPFEFLRADNGNCRVYYRRKRHQHGSYKLYCLQTAARWKGAPAMEMLICTRDGEPTAPILPDYFRWDLIPPPTGGSQIESEAREFLKTMLDTQQGG